MVQERLEGDDKNWKGLLQKYCLQMKVTLRYDKIDEEGLVHDKVFTVGVYLEDEKIHEGLGKSIKEAEKNASKNALEHQETHGH